MARCPEASPNPHPWKASENRDRRKNLHHPPVELHLVLCLVVRLLLSCVFAKTSGPASQYCPYPGGRSGLRGLGCLQSGIAYPHPSSRSSGRSRHAIYRRALSLNRLHPHALQHTDRQDGFSNGVSGVFDGAGGPCLIESGRLTLPGMLRDQGYRTACYGKWHVGLTFFDSQGAPIHQNGLKAVQKIDYTRAIPDGPIHRGFDAFFGTACCPTTDWLYAYIDGDRVPSPPTRLLDRSPFRSTPTLAIIDPE